MKNRLKIIITIVVAIAGYGIYQTQTEKNTMSEIAMTNVEALATGENGDDCHYVNGYSSFGENPGGSYDCCKIWVNKEPRQENPDCR